MPFEKETIKKSWKAIYLVNINQTLSIVNKADLLSKSD